MGVIEQEWTEEQGDITYLDPDQGVSDLGKLMLEAARLIEERGWTQDHNGNYDIGFCAIGAMYYANEAMFEGRDLIAPNRTFLYRLVEYNDRPGRRKEEVIERLRELAPIVM